MDHRSQLLKGVLDMCLLAIISEEPSYGYEMADKLSRRGLHLMSEGSIYPTLSRMQRSSLIEGFFVEADGSGPPRKYYRIAPEGEQRLTEWRNEWSSLRDGVDEVLKGVTT
ncbi:MAG TPA: PadR family transcriptional regulator [Acidimicrobiia bacterium]|nr:PadR family transcriptional regulator [Acidimicrobiia bacterium]